MKKQQEFGQDRGPQSYNLNEMMNLEKYLHTGKSSRKTFQSPPGFGFWDADVAGKKVTFDNFGNSFTFVCALSHFSHVRLFATLWTTALQAPLVHGILRARKLKWITMPSSRVSSRPKKWTCVARIAGRFFTHWATWRAPVSPLVSGD